MKSLLFIILISFFSVFVAAQSNQTIPAGEIGSQLPSFETNDLQGKKISSNDFKNKVVLIDFWGTWCAPCVKEMPGYQKLVDQYGSRGFSVIGLKVDIMADTEDPIQFIKKLGIHYPIAVGTEEIRDKFGGIQGIPTTYIFDRAGILRSKIIGFEYTTTIEKTIKTLL
jgi:thiol-disulfide isomerase/thioredoxin